MPANMPGMAPLAEAPKSLPTNAPAFPMRAKAIPTIPVIFRALLTSFAGLPCFRVVRYFGKDDRHPIVCDGEGDDLKALAGNFICGSLDKGCHLGGLGAVFDTECLVHGLPSQLTINMLVNHGVTL